MNIKYKVSENKNKNKKQINYSEYSLQDVEEEEELTVKQAKIFLWLITND